MGCFRRRVTKATADAEGSSSHQDARLGEAQRRCGHDYACSRGGRLTQGLSPLPPPTQGREWLTSIQDMPGEAGIETSAGGVPGELSPPPEGICTLFF